MCVDRTAHLACVSRLSAVRKQLLVSVPPSSSTRAASLIHNPQKPQLLASVSQQHEVHHARTCRLYVVNTANILLIYPLQSAHQEEREGQKGSMQLMDMLGMQLLNMVSSAVP